MNQNVEIGCRIHYDCYFGTVQYFGKLGNNTGQWLGVEWDDENRGKHDGCHDNVQYFKTKASKAGSFLRLNKVDFGQPIVSGIKERYGRAKEEEENFGIFHETLVLPQASGKQVRIIEVVGMKGISETQSKFDSLKVVSLRGLLVNGAGPPNVLAEFSPIIMDLDLSKNLISSWDKLAEITIQLPYLKFLNISENRLTLTKDPKQLIGAFKSVRQLLMHDMKYNWSEIIKCVMLVSDVENVALVRNNARFLTVPPSDIMNKLKEINLEFNGIEDWEEVMKLGNLPCLEHMNVSNNGLPSLFFKDAAFDEKTNFFPKLNTLSISNNKLENWKDVAALNKLKKLENLTFKNNPVIMSLRTENIRMNLAARIEGLKIINHSEVSAVDRKGAESEYIRAYGKQWLEASKNEEILPNFYESHPRYKYFISVYGAPDPAELEEKSRLLKSNLIRVEIRTSQLQENLTYRKKISNTMTVKKLKTLVQRLVKYDRLQNLELAYVTRECSDFEITLDNDLRSVSYYSVEDDGIIIAKWRCCF